MSAAAVRAAIVATLAAVPDVGVVNAFERYANDQKRLVQFYTTTIDDVAQLRGWYVHRVAKREWSPGRGRVVIAETWEIRGFMALSDTDESELAFDALVETICTAFRVDETLGGVVAGLLETEDGAESGLQMPECAPYMFGGVLCHAVRLQMTTMRYL